MAAAGSAPGGFSYAQAARGKQNGGASQPHELSNPTPAKDWAEDAEDNARAKAQDGGSEIDSTSTDKSNAVSKLSAGSEISSPDVASATSHDDISSTTQNASSTSSWEAKSQGSDTVVSSEPAWIAERKERQSTQKVESKSDTEATQIAPEQKPVLHEAAPPAVNPWARRAEEAKAKQVTAPISKPVAPATMVRNAQNKENQKPKSDWQHKASPSVQSIKADNVAKPTRAAQKSAPQPPSVKDQTSWPTPEVKIEEKKAVTTHTQTEPDEDANSGKPRKKQEWKPVAVVPNIIWETPGVQSRVQRSSPNGERAPRGGASSRGRGGARGASNAAHADRAQASDNTPPTEAAHDAEHETRPPKPQRKAQREHEEINGDSTGLAKATDVPAASVDPPASTESFGDARKDTRNGEHKEFSTIRGGARRGGRGRGGRGDLANGHAHFTNGHAPEFSPAHAGSPTHVRGNFQYGPGRAGRASNNRAQSLPFGVPDMRYGFYPQQFMYPMDPYAMGMPPQAPYLDYSPHIITVTQQLDYYFSIDNLLKDTYLRKNMDAQGFVLLEVIAAFNRIKQLTTDPNIIKLASYQSEVVEVVVGSDGKERLRKASDWEKWVLPAADRFTAAQNEGPQQFENLHKQYAQAPRPHMSLPYINARGGDRRSYDFSYGMGTQLSPQAMFAPEYMPGNYNGFDETRGRQTKPTAYENGVAPEAAAQSPHEATNVSSDDKIGQMAVYAKNGNDKSSQYNAASQTLTNGSIDATAVEKDLATTQVNGETGTAALEV